MAKDSSVIPSRTPIINFVYSLLRQEDCHAVHKGHITIAWSGHPIAGCDVYVYQDAFSYKGKKGGLDILLMLQSIVALPGEFDEHVWTHFDYILTLSDSLTEHGEKFRKIYFPHFGRRPYTALTEKLEDRRRVYPTQGRRNAICMINGYKESTVPSELYSTRTEIARWFHDHSDIAFDVYGSPPFPLPNYKCALENANKLPTLKQFKYSLCFENTNHPILSLGCITDTILDCLETRTVPIYLGASNVEQYIPDTCFIDYRRFKEYEDLNTYLHSLSEGEYQRYIDGIDAFVCSGGMKKNTVHELYDAVVRILTEVELLGPEHFSKDSSWLPGIAPSLERKEWKASSIPVMWTEKYLSRTSSPLLGEKPVHVDRSIPRGSHDSLSTIQSNKHCLTRGKETIRLLVAGTKYSDGNARKGYDYGWWNFIDALSRFNNIQRLFFDYVTEARQMGVAGMVDHLVELVRKEKPDVLIFEPFDVHADILQDSLRFITEHTDTQTIIWMSDDHRRFSDFSRSWAPCADRIITTDQGVIEKFHHAGFGEKIIKSQWAFNPFTYAVQDMGRLRSVSFIGMAHGSRPEIIHKMRQSGIQVDAFGAGWLGDIDIPFSDMVRIFCQSKINLNLSTTLPFTTHQMERRNFEVPGCRGFLITPPVDNLEAFYEPDKEVVIASSLEELIDKSKYYLVHDRIREEIAQRGYERTLAEHTWMHRFIDIFKQIGFTAVPQSMPRITKSPFLQPVEAGSTGGCSTEFPHQGVNNHERHILATIVVTCYNQVDYTKLCVESILHYTSGPYELILLDNGSNDGTIEYFEQVKSFHPDSVIIRNLQNRNVEATSRYVFSIARGTYIVSVTNDTMVHEGWLTNLIRHIESAPDIGMVGPRSNNISGPQLAQGDYDSLETYQTFAAEWSRLHQGENFPIERMVGMFTIAKKSVYERIGGFDPDLPTNGRDGGYGFSDDDLSVRMRLAGYRLLVANDVFIHHYGSRTASRYRPDLFGPAQNLNKEKYLRKLLNNDRITIEADGRMKLKPYRLEDKLPVDERMRIRPLRICFVETGDPLSDIEGRYNAMAERYDSQIIKSREESIQSQILKIIDGNQYDFLVHINSRLDPHPDAVSALAELSMCYPDVAVMVPVGNYAPSTHTHKAGSPLKVEIIPYADLSLCAINLKIIRPLRLGLAACENDDEFLWFLQRRVRGEGYFIAKANDIEVNGCIPTPAHAYVTRKLPEQLAREKRFTEAIPIHRDDLRKDPNFAGAHYQLACIAREQRQTGEAVIQAQLALRADPHHIETIIFLSNLYMDENDWDRAGTFVRQASFKKPGHPDVQKTVERYEGGLKEKSSCPQSEGISKKSAQGVSGAEHDKISIVVTASSQHMDTCLKTLKKYTPEPYELIVIDRLASPDSRKKLIKIVKKGYSHYKILEHCLNDSLSQSLNKGLNSSTGEYIVLLTDDIVVSDGWLSSMLRSMKGTDNIGLIGPMCNMASPSQFIENNLPHNNLDQLRKFAQDIARGNTNKTRDVIQLDYFCLLMRRPLLNVIGGFDERCESWSFACDDLCLRSHLAGYRNVVAQDVFVHRQGRPAPKGDGGYFFEKWKEHVTVDGNDCEVRITSEQRLKKILELGEQLFSQGDLRAAAQSFERVLLLDEANSEALNNLGVIQWQIGDTVSAMETFQTALTVNPGDHDALANLLQTATETGRVDLLNKDTLGIVKQAQPENPDITRLIESCQGNTSC